MATVTSLEGSNLGAKASQGIKRYTGAFYCPFLKIFLQGNSTLKDNKTPRACRSFCDHGTKIGKACILCKTSVKLVDDTQNKLRDGRTECYGQSVKAISTLEISGGFGSLF